MILNVKPNTKAAAQLFFEGQKTFADLEQNGIRVDMKHMAENELAVEKAGKKALAALDEYKETHLWRKLCKKSGKAWKPATDTASVARLLYDELGYKPTSFTDSGVPSADDNALQDIDTPFSRTLLRVRKMYKANTYLQQIKRETIDGVVHTFFNLQLVDTYRSSADSPSFQNMPNRDEEQMQLVRSNLFPRLRHQMGESDFKGVEVGIGICYHGDPLMLSYWNDKSKDMHRDQACECYILDPKQVGKKIRHAGKNSFVFPSFYGSFWANTAPSLWKAIKRNGLVTEDGVPLYDHLADQGITELGDCDPEGRPQRGTFAYHIMEVENRFWNERFKVYTQWKKKWFAAYLKRGYFDTLTGFRVSGVLRRNQVINYPIQGDAFHCLLRTLIALNKWLHKNHMDTRLIGQIHDSLMKDYAPAEVKPVIAQTRFLIEKDIRNEWKWITVPLSAEFELAPVDGSLAEKKEYKAA